MARSRALPVGRGPPDAPHPRRSCAGPPLPEARRRAVTVTLDGDIAVPSEPGRDLVALDDALATLARVDERKSRVVELRFFGGLTVAETATVLSVSVDTIMRDWKLAKAWLLRELGGGRTDRPGERA